MNTKNNFAPGRGIEATIILSTDVEPSRCREFEFIRVQVSLKTLLGKPGREDSDALVVDIYLSTRATIGRNLSLMKLQSQDI